MRLSTSPSFVYALGIGLFVFGACLPATASADDVVIGVISPIDGRPIGLAHQESVRLAFNTLDPTISSGTALALLKPLFESDDGNDQQAVQKARDLVAAGAIAIIGPADTRSTQAVLDAGLNVPVISALSTATSLTDPSRRDKWFFRVTLNDSLRMRLYVDALHKHGLLDQSQSPYVLYDDESPYGKGLAEDLVAALKPTEAVIFPWSATDVDSIATKPPSPTNIFILGTNTVGVQHARKIDLALRGAGGQARYLFVGDDGDLRKSAPPGSVTIGEPTIVDAAGSDIAALRKEYAKAAGPDADELQVTAYEAAYVVHQAIESIVRANAHQSGGLKSRSKQELSDALRTTLETEEFASLEPWRMIKFKDGEMQGAPTLAVYQSNASFTLIDVPVPQPFLEVIAPESAGYLQGPITVRVIPHQTDPTDKLPKITVLRDRRNADPALVDARTGVDSAGVPTLTFYAALPGTYRLSAGPMMSMKPARPAVQVGVSAAYVFALAGAALGSVLFILTAPRPTGEAVRRFVLGVITGCAIAALYFHRDLVPGGVSFPKLGDTETAAAFWDGVAGGWLGPSILVLLLVPILGVFGKTKPPTTEGPAAGGAGPASPTPPASGAPPAPSTPT